MSAAILSIDLSKAKFVTADELPATIKLTLTAKPKVDDSSLMCIAVRFEERLKVITTFLSSALRKHCQKLYGADISTHEAEISKLLVEEVRNNSETLEVPFQIISADLILSCEAYQIAGEEGTKAKLAHARLLKELENANEVDLAKLRYATTPLEQAWIEFEHDLKKAGAEGRTRAEIEELRVSAYSAMERLTDAAQIAAASNPEVARSIADIISTRLSNDSDSRERAIKEVLQFLKGVGDIEANMRERSSNGINIVNS